VIYNRSARVTLLWAKHLIKRNLNRNSHAWVRPNSQSGYENPLVIFCARTMVYFIFSKYYKKNWKQCILPNDAAVEGVNCVARKYGHMYYRVIITETLSPFRVRCRFIDHGYEMKLSKTYLWCLHKDFKHIPNQAIYAEWYGALPFATNWTPQDRAVFKDIIAGAEKLEAKVENYNQVR